MLSLKRSGAAYARKRTVLATSGDSFTRIYCQPSGKFSFPFWNGGIVMNICVGRFANLDLKTGTSDNCRRPEYARLIWVINEGALEGVTGLLIGSDQDWYVNSMSHKFVVFFSHRSVTPYVDMQSPD